MRTNRLFRDLPPAVYTVPDDGERAFLAGWAAHANPHPSGTDAHEAWAAAWLFIKRVHCGMRGE